MFDDFKELLSALNKHKVKYLVVGAYAVGYHAQPRATKDLDVLVQPAPRNAEAVYRALVAFGAPNIQKRTPADFAEMGTFFRMGVPPIAIDILPEIKGVVFDAAWKNRVAVTVDTGSGLVANFISRDDLITAKLAAGRKQDLADVEAIRNAASATATHSTSDSLAGPKLGKSRKAPRKIADTHLAFISPGDLGTWLSKHHATAKVLWVQIFRKDSDTPTVTWVDCVVEAIAWGWIDGQKKPLNEASFLQRLSPRKPKSNWSQKNKEHAERLIAAGRMMPAGQVHVEAAKADGRWEAAYAGSATMTIPDDFIVALEGSPEAKAFFETLNRTNLFAIYHRLHTAKRPETRLKRIQTIIEQLARRERFH